MVLHWVDAGITVFRVDNPHTKPFEFWRWLIENVHAQNRDVVFLAEAFTRRSVMRHLAKIGFSQSYTYFTWKNTRWELTEYVSELALTDESEYFRPNFFVNTPDILNEYLQLGGRPAFEARLVLAATLSPTYGIYSGYEHFENVPVREGSEEYLHSEKYEIKQRALDGPLLPMIQQLNQIRRENPALQNLENVTFLDTANDALIAYAKHVAGQHDHHCRQHRPPPGPGGPRDRPRQPRPAAHLHRPRPADRRALPVADRRQLRPVRTGRPPGARRARRDVDRAPPGLHMSVGPPTLTHLIAAETRTTPGPPPQQDGAPQAQAQTRQWFEHEPLWFKRAVFYEIHIRGFFDANGDGSGDFRGLTEKLDYLQWLGIDCIWLLPFYRSPLRDGGYDIADFATVHPDYGTVEDVHELIDAAHARRIRVIADLVMNHTSSDHPWFQESRSSPDSPKRDWYVWSDTPERYQDARIIFIDTESSNWTWDPAAGAYYWHRFFSHQPDLNYDNPEVQETMIEVLRFWLDLGLDGFRLDAVPYLFEREGTNCENLPETHAYLKRIRKEIDENYPDRVLLAEANQWPADVVQYFGDGDECQMAFHFPVMPRMFMAIRREQAAPIYEILESTPPIPDGCSVGPVPPQPRRAHARDGHRRGARLHVHRVREGPADEAEPRDSPAPRSAARQRPRRDRAHARDPVLAAGIAGPLLRRRDRDGRQRVPRRPRRRADTDAVDGRSQRRLQPGGLRPALRAAPDGPRVRLPGGQRGGPPAHPHLALALAAPLHRAAQGASGVRLRHLRADPDRPTRGSSPTSAPSRTMSSCASTTSAATAQAVELDLSAYEARYPVELFGHSRFPRIGQLPYLLTLGPRGFFWFQLVDEEHDDDE